MSRRRRPARSGCVGLGRVGKTLVPGGIGVAERARQKSDDGVQDHRRAKLAAREDVVADRELQVAEVVGHPLIDALITPADKDYPGGPS